MDTHEHDVCIFCSDYSNNSTLYINNTCDCKYMYHANCWNKHVVSHSSYDGTIPLQVPCPSCKIMVSRNNTHLKNSKRDVFINSSPVICCGCFGAVLASIGT
jgi:hypothetical protein